MLATTFVYLPKTPESINNNKKKKHDFRWNAFFYRYSENFDGQCVLIMEQERTFDMSQIQRDPDWQALLKNQSMLTKITEKRCGRG